MADNSAVLSNIVYNHLRFILKWFKVSESECAICSKSFISAAKDPSSDEIIVLPVSSSASWSFSEIRELRECLPIQPSTPLTLAIVDPSTIVSLYSVFDGLSEELHHRTWRPSRSFLENPEKCLESGARKADRARNRARQDQRIDRPILPQNASEDVIVIDD